MIISCAECLEQFQISDGVYSPTCSCHIRLGVVRVRSLGFADYVLHMMSKVVTEEIRKLDREESEKLWLKEQKRPVKPRR